MMQFKINLATRTYINVAWVNATFMLSGFMLAAWLVVNVLFITQNFKEISKMKEEAIAVSTGRNGRLFTAKEIQAITDKVKFVTEIYKTGSAGWLTLLNNLEAVTPEGISIKSISKGKESEIKLVGTAKNFRVVRNYLEMLVDSKTFHDVYLVSQGSTKFGKKQTGVTFTISCKALL